MDYILQTEKIFKFLELNLGFQEMKNIIGLKKEFNNDFNLIGCFLMDILNLENQGENSSDDKLYNDFVICFDKYQNQNKTNEFVMKLLRYSKYYQMLVYEETDNRVLLTAIATINSCNFIEFYPFMMELIDEFLNQKITRIHFMLMLQLITDTVISNYDKGIFGEVDLIGLRNKLKEISSRQIPERVAI